MQASAASRPSPPPPLAALRELAAHARRPAVAGALVAAWALLSCVSLLGTWLSPGIKREVVLSLTLSDSVTWMLLFGLGVAGGWLLPVDRRPTARQLAAVLAFALALFAGRLALLWATRHWTGWTPPPSFWYVLVFYTPRHLVIATTCVGLGCGARSILRERDEAARLAALEAGLARARFQSLRGRLQPDFLLAGLDAIARRMHHDARAADRELVRLSELLRRALLRGTEEWVPLADELDFVALYLGVDRGAGARPARLHADVPPGLGTCLVPPGSVLALAEAPVRLAGPGPAPLTLRLRAERTGGRLRVTLEDDLPVPLAGRRPREEWSGVAGLAAALGERFGPGHALRTADLPAGGAATVLEVPLRQLETSAAEAA